jgi:hypothetical protein
MNRFLLAPALLAPAFLGLASCGTPQQECIRMVSRDVIVVDRLIAETQTNLARGYALAERQVSYPVFVDCTPDPWKGHPHPRARTCLDEETRTETYPVAIDPVAEQAKLNGLLTKRTQLAKATAPAVAQCQARYPE